MWKLMQVNIPSPEAPPGMDGLLGNLMSWAMWAGYAGGGLAVVVGIAMWALGSVQADGRLATTGKKGVGVGVLAILVLGVLPQLLGSLSS